MLAVEPVTAKGQRTATLILDVTLDLLESEGFRAITTNRIAAVSGIKVGSIYRFYPNKEAIFLALIRRWHSNIQTTIRVYIEAADDTSDFAKLVGGLFHSVLEQDYKKAKSYRELILGAGTMPVLQSEVQAHSLKLARLVAKYYLPKRPRQQVIEFCVFIQVTVASAQRQVAGLRGNKRKRQIAWLLSMLDAAVAAFDAEVTTET